MKNITTKRLPTWCVRLLLALAAVLCISGGAGAVAVPTKVQRIACENWISNSAVFQWVDATHYKCILNNKTQAGNGIIVVVMWPTAGAVAAGGGGGGTVALTDDGGNTYNSIVGPVNTVGIVQGQAFVANNVAANTEVITLTFSTNIASSGDAGHWMDVEAGEFNNLQASFTGMVDGTSTNTGSGTAVTSGSFTPGTSGDLVMMCAFDDNHDTNIYTRNAAPFVLWEVNTLDESSACQWEVQAAAAAVNPQINMTTTDAWAALGFALKASASAQGSPVPTGSPYVENTCVSPVNGQFATKSQAIQCPSDTNFLAITYNAQTGVNICTSASTPAGCVAFISDNKGNTWHADPIEVGTGGSGDEETLWTENATTGPDYSVTVTWNVSGPTVATVYIHSVAGMATSGSSCGAPAGATSSIATASWTGTAVITPCQANGIVFGMMGNQSNNGIAVSPGKFQEPDQNNTRFFWYNGATTTGTSFTYTDNVAPGAYVEYLHAFKGAPTGPVFPAGFGGKSGLGGKSGVGF